MMDRVGFRRKNHSRAGLLAFLLLSCGVFLGEVRGQSARTWVSDDSEVQSVPFHEHEFNAEQSGVISGEIATTSCLERLSHLEQELISLRRELSYEQVTGSSGEVCAVDYYDSWWRPCSLRGGVDIILLKPRLEDGGEEDSATNALDFHLDVTPRIWLDLFNSNGKGARARYWQFTDASHSSNVLHVPIIGNEHQMLLNAYTIDLEVAKSFDLEDWQLILGAGVRYARLEQQVLATDTGDFALKRFDAVGPTISVDSRNQIGRTKFSWVANLRSAILVGHSDWSTSSESQTTDDIGAIAEVQIGLEHRFRHDPLGELFIRLLWEQQHWFGAGTHFSGTNTVGNASFGLQPDDYDIAFMGFGLTVGIAR